MDGGCFILEPEADNSPTILINIWYFSLEKHCEQVRNYIKRTYLTVTFSFDPNVISRELTEKNDRGLYT